MHHHIYIQVLQYLSVQNQLTWRAMENKYKAGQIVFATAIPEVVLIVRRYVDRIYYCRVKGSESDRDVVCFERELEAFDDKG